MYTMATSILTVAKSAVILRCKERVFTGDPMMRGASQAAW